MSVTLHTDLGDIKLELFVDETPVSCENFLAHCARGTYNGTNVIKLIKGFIVQFGDPTNKGKGGESVWGGYFQDEIRPNLEHSRRGIVSMANAGRPDTNGSQFFITLDRAPVLDGKYTVFGEVTDGMAVLAKMEQQIQVKSKNNKPLQDCYIRDLTIHANPIADKQS